MKNKILSFVIFIVLSAISCGRNKPYTIYWSDNNLCVVLPHPTIGIVGFGHEDWKGVDLNQVAEDIYKECIKSGNSGDIIIWARFENPQTDKYGNETMFYNDYEIATIPLSEACKYKSGKFLDSEYKLSLGFRKAAFGKILN